MDNNKYRFVHFRASITLRVPREAGDEPAAVAECFNDALIQHFTAPDYAFLPPHPDGNVWQIVTTNRPRTVDQASQL